MKVWTKYLIGVALGIITAIVLPMNNPSIASFFTFLNELFVRFGRYIVVPLIFCTGIVSVNKLRTSKLLVKSSMWTAIIIIISSLILAAIGLASILLVKLPRIPITIDTVTETYSLDIRNLVLALFPDSAFETLKEGSFLLVSLVFAGLIGWASASDFNAFKPTFALANSLSKLFYNIAVGFTEILSICMIAIMCNWAVTFKSVWSTGIYTPIILMLLCDFVIVAGIIYPLIIRFVCHDPHPYKVLYASVAPMILAFIGNDTNLSIPLNIRHGKESLGIRRRVSGFTYPIFSIFARGGSALVAIISFIVIWRSYSSLSIPITDIIWIFSISFGLSFLLGGIPSGGAFILLTVLCTKYGRGFETSYLLLQPASLIICSFASIFENVTTMFGTYIVAVKTKMIEHYSITHFI